MKLMRTIMLPTAILCGLLFPAAGEWAWSVKWLLGAMVFMAFVGPVHFSWQSTRSVLVRIMPVWLLLAPILGYITSLLFPNMPGLAWAVFLVCVAPTATAAPAVIRMGGGDPSLVVSGVVLQHLLVGILVPFWVGVTGMSDANPWILPQKILLGTLPLVVIPLGLAMLLRRLKSSWANQLVRFQPGNLFLWAIAVFFVVAKARADFALLHLHGASMQIGLTALFSLLLCALQFALGRKLISGQHQEEGAQILGQKNTILAIWIATNWFGPWAVLGPLFYILWQNLYIAWQAARGVKFRA